MIAIIALRERRGSGSAIHGVLAATGDAEGAPPKGEYTGAAGEYTGAAGE